MKPRPQLELFDSPAPVVRGTLTPREIEREGIATGPIADRPRLNKQCQVILERLQKGSATNTELNTICFRYGARIYDLRKAGYAIDSEVVGGGVWKFTLKQNADH